MPTWVLEHQLDPNSLAPLNTWEDEFSAWSIFGNAPNKTVRVGASTVPYTRYGAQGGLLRPAADTTLGQRIVARFLAVTVGYTGTIVLRDNTNTRQKYAFVFERKTGTPDTGKIRIFYFDNYLGGNVGTTSLKANDNLTAIVAGHEYELEAYVYGSSPTTIRFIVRDVTAGTTLYDSGEFDNSAAGAQTVGQMGLGIDVNKANYTLVQTYKQTSITADPDDVGIGVANQAIDVTGIGTNFLASGFTLAGGTGASITSVGLDTDTHATVNINTGTAAGVLTLTDNLSGLTTQIVVSPLLSPDAAIGSVEPGGATVAALERPQFGQAPYLVELWRGTNANFNALAGEGTLVASQVAGASDDVEDVIDASAPAGLAYYRWVTRDSAGNTAQGLAVGTTIPIDAGARDTILFGGDSITVGVGAGETYMRELVNLDFLTSSADWTTASISFSPSGPEATPVIVGGKLAYAIVTKRGSITGDPTATITGDGSSVTTKVQAGGGQVAACMDVLAMKYGYSNLRAENTAQGGTKVSDWLPNATSGKWYLARMLAHAQAASVRAAVIGLGTNDAGDRRATATVKAEARTIVQTILDAGIPVVAWIKPISRVVSSSNLAQTNALILEYHQALEELEAEFPGRFYAVCGRAFQYSLAHPEQFLDGVHPTDKMYGPMGALLADELAPLLRALLPSEALDAAPVQATGSLTIRRGYDHTAASDTELELTLAADLAFAGAVYLVDPWSPSLATLLPATVEPLVGGAARLVWEIPAADSAKLVRRDAMRWNIVAAYGLSKSLVATVEVAVV